MFKKYISSFKYILMDKPKVVKDYEKLDLAIQEQIKLNYPNGFKNHLIQFYNKDGKLVSALPFETEEKYYLVRMTVNEAQQIIEDDEDYDDDGILKDEVKEEYEEKYDEVEDDSFEDKYYDEPEEDDVD
jgi:hypothetical protein